ncbi:MAG: hypothetical protein IJX77_00420 [Ruminococcus sp.]|nr:hypothetical protein [Ruminococcus sp.]
MKQSEYRNTLDKIKCSKEFSAKMEELLSKKSEAHENFADTVTDVEHAPRRNIGRYITGAAACAVVCCAAGAIYKTAVKIPENGNEAASSTITTVASENPTELGAAEDSPFENLWRYTIYDEATGWVSDTQVIQLSKLFRETSFESIAPPATACEGIVLKIYNEGLHSSMSIREDGIVEYYKYDESLTEDEQYSVSESLFYKTDTELYSNVRDTIDGGHVDAESLINLFDVSEDVTGSYLPDGGQFTASIEFSFERAAQFKENLLSYEWKQIPADDFVYEDFYILNGMIVNESGQIMGNGGGGNTAYQVVGDVSDKIAEFIRHDMESDELANLMLMLSTADEKYETMEADIEVENHIIHEEQSSDGNSVSHAEYSFLAEGKLYHSNPENLSYISVSGTADNNTEISAKSIVSDYNEVYIEQGDDIDKLNPNRAFITDSNGNQTTYVRNEAINFTGETSDLNYVYLDKLVSYDISYIISECEICGIEHDLDNHYICTEEGEYKDYYISSEPFYSSQLPEMTLEITIDKNGNIVRYHKTLNEETVCSFELTNVKYDSEEFNMPELTEEEELYFTVDCGASIPEVSFSDTTE